MQSLYSLLMFLKLLMQVLLEKDQSLMDYQETVEILQVKVRKLEQLVLLKDKRIEGTYVSVPRSFGLIFFPLHCISIFVIICSYLYMIDLLACIYKSFSFFPFSLTHCSPFSYTSLTHTMLIL